MFGSEQRDYYAISIIYIIISVLQFLITLITDNSTLVLRGKNEKDK